MTYPPPSGPYYQPDNGSGQPMDPNAGSPQQAPPPGQFDPYQQIQPLSFDQPQNQPPPMHGGYPPQPGMPSQQNPADPYAPPSAQPDPYGQPVTGVPFQQGGYQQQPYGQPQYGAPLPAVPPKNNTGWIVGGVIGVVLLLVATGVVLYATGALGSSNNTATTTTSSDPSSQSVDDGDEPGDDQDTTGYVYVSSFCNDVDRSMFLDQFKDDDNPLDMTTDLGSRGSMACGYGLSASDTSSFAHAYLSVTASSFPDASAAKESFRGIHDYAFITGGTPETYDGDWEIGEIVRVSDSTNKEYDLGIYIQDSNLTLAVEFTSTGADYGDGLEEKVLAAVQQILTVVAV